MPFPLLLRGNPASKQIAYRTVMGEKSDRMTGLPIAMMISHGKKMPKLSLPADQRKVDLDPTYQVNPII